MKEYLIGLLAIVPFILCGQSLPYVPYQVEWAGYPWVAKLNMIKEMHCEIVDANHRTDRSLDPRRSQGGALFDSLGRNYSYVSSADSLLPVSSVICQTGYDDSGCPVYYGRTRDPRGWVVLNKQFGTREHCREGKIDTLECGKTIALDYDSIGNLVQRRQVTKTGKVTTTEFVHDAQGRLLQANGMENYTISYCQDSILVQRFHSKNDNFSIVYLLNAEGLPEERRYYSYHRAVKRQRLEETTYYSYIWRK